MCLAMAWPCEGTEDQRVEDEEIECARKEFKSGLTYRAWNL